MEEEAQKAETQKAEAQKAENELKNEQAKVLRFQSIVDKLRRSYRKNTALHTDQEAELKAKNDELTNEMEKLKSKIKTLTDENEVNRQSSTTNQDTKKLKVILAREQQEHAKLKSKLSELEQSMESIKDQHFQQKVVLRGKNEELNNKLKLYTNKNKQLINENKSYCQRLTENQEKLKKLEADFDDERNLRVKLESTVSDLQKLLQTAELRNSERESVLMKEKEELTNTLNEYKRKNEELSNENRSKFESLAATEDRLKKIELTLKSEEEYSKKRESFSVTLQEKCSLLECQNNELVTKLKQKEQMLTNKIQEYDKIIENMSNEITLERTLREKRASPVKEQLSKAEYRCQELELRLSEMQTTELQHIQRETAAKNANEKLLSDIEQYKIKIEKLSKNLNHLQEASQSRRSQLYLPVKEKTLATPRRANEKTNEQESEEIIQLSDTSDEDDCGFDGNRALDQIRAGCSVILKRMTAAQINQFIPFPRRRNTHCLVISESSSDNGDTDAEVETSKNDYDNLFAASPCPTCSGSSDDEDHHVNTAKRETWKQPTTSYQSLPSPNLCLKLVKNSPKKTSPVANENKNSNYSSIYGSENINPNKVLSVRISNYKPTNEIDKEKKKTLERVKSSLQINGSVVAKRGLSSPQKKRKSRRTERNSDEFPSLTKKKKLKKSSAENCATDVENRIGDMRANKENTTDPTLQKCNVLSDLRNHEIQISSPTNAENQEFNDLIIFDVNKNISHPLRKGHDTVTVPNSEHVSSLKEDTYKKRDVFQTSVEQMADDLSTRRPSFTADVQKNSNDSCSNPIVIVTDPVIENLSSFVQLKSWENRMCQSSIEQNKSEAILEPNDLRTIVISHFRSTPLRTEPCPEKSSSFPSFLVQSIRLDTPSSNSDSSSRCVFPAVVANTMPSVANTNSDSTAVCQSSKEQNIHIYEYLADSTPTSKCTPPSSATIPNTLIVPSLLNSNCEKSEIHQSSVEQNESACRPTPELKNLLLNSPENTLCQYTKSTSAGIEITERISLEAHQVEETTTAPVTEERNLESARIDASESNAVQKSTGALPKSTRGLIKVRSRTELFDLPESSTTVPSDVNKLLCVDTAVPHMPNLSSTWSFTPYYSANVNSPEKDLLVLVNLLKNLYEENHKCFGKRTMPETDLTQKIQQLILEFRETFVRRLKCIRSVCGNEYENESKDLLRQILSRLNAELNDEIKNCKNYSVILNEFFLKLAVEDFFPQSWFHCTMEIIQVNEIDRTVNSVVNTFINKVNVNAPPRRRAPAKPKNVSNKKMKQTAGNGNQNKQASNNTNQNVQMMNDTVSNIQMMNNISNQNTEVRCYANKNMKARINNNQNTHVISNMNQNMQMSNSINQNTLVMNTNPNMMPVQSNILFNRPISPQRVHPDFMDKRRAQMVPSVNSVLNSNTLPRSASYMNPQLQQYLPSPPPYESHIQQNMPLLSPQQLHFPGRDIHHPIENDQLNQQYTSMTLLPSNYY